uniref:Uncharacterized protein n=1 Tax=Babesia bovis TaxID=5865 RepID=S6B6V9_BABBO|nr:hypothetical protein [Babesia bovis]
MYLKIVADSFHLRKIFPSLDIGHNLYSNHFWYCSIMGLTSSVSLSLGSFHIFAPPGTPVGPGVDCVGGLGDDVDPPSCEVDLGRSLVPLISATFF